MSLPRSTRRANTSSSAACLSMCNESPSSSLPILPWVCTTFCLPLADDLVIATIDLHHHHRGFLSLSSSSVESVVPDSRSLLLPTHERGIASRVRILPCCERLIKPASIPLADDFVSCHFLCFVSLYSWHFLSQLSFTSSNCSVPSIYIIALFRIYCIPFQPSCIRASSAYSSHRTLLIHPSIPFFPFLDLLHHTLFSFYPFERSICLSNLPVFPLYIVLPFRSFLSWCISTTNQSQN